MKAGAFVVGIIAIVLAVFLSWEVVPGSPGESSYQTAELARGDVTVEVTATGRAAAVDTIEVSSQLSGQVAELSADFNDRVDAGQPLARLDDKTFEAAVHEARARLALVKSEYVAAAARTEGARARFDEAKKDFARRSELRQKGTVSSRDLDRSRMEMLSADSDVRAGRADEAVKQAAILMAEAALRRAEIDLERTVIRSPIDGVVIKRSVELGQTVAASLQAPTLFTIAHDLRQMEVHARVDEADIGRVEIGQSAVFSVDAYPDRTFQGLVIEIRKAPEVVQNVVTYTVVIGVDNPDLSLLPGMTTLIRITVDERRNVFVVPNSALQYVPAGGEPTEGGERVWVLEEDGLRPIEVVTGLDNGAVTEIANAEMLQGKAIIVGEIVSSPERRLFGLRFGF